MDDLDAIDELMKGFEFAEVSSPGVTDQMVHYMKLHISRYVSMHAPCITPLSFTYCQWVRAIYENITNVCSYVDNINW